MILFSALTVVYKANLKYQTLYLFFCLFILAVFTGLRSRYVGHDYLNYKEMFYDFDSLFSGGFGQVLEGNYFFEPGFALLISFISIFSNNHIVFFIIIASLSSLIMGVTLKKLSIYPILSLLIFFSYDFFTNFMIAIRFGIAASIALLVLYFISINKKIISLFLIFLAMSLHMASIGLFIPFLLSFLNFKRSYVLLIIGVSLIIGYIGLGSFFLNHFLPNWVPRVQDAQMYSESLIFGTSLGFLGFINIKYILLSIIVFLYWHKLKERVPHFYPLVLFLISAMAIRVGLHDLGFIASRVSALLGIVEIIIVPVMMISLIKQKIFAYSFVAIYAFIHLYFMLFVRGFSYYTFVTV